MPETTTANSPAPTKADAQPREIVWQYITLVSIYYVTIGILLIFNLASIWPASLDEPSRANVLLFFQTMEISNEVRLILIVTMAGALGSLVHGYRSLFWYVGNKAFVRSWTLMYLLLPFVGSTLSIIFYFVLRGGLFSAQATVEATSPFGFAGIAGLVGMFSNKAALKLQEIAESIFSTKQSTKGADNVEPQKGTTVEK